ncbi:hypothetical protein [Pseudotenacibaculum haliotis]|uniref:Outer membrane protein beta-barrel domain-containing protein n=1 Tax=Pseudotenacibaculum haliotis TaxID=1862138 RepID=A0ABW5LSC3_9FLAO
MKRILIILVLFCTTIAMAQERTFESEVKRISKKIDRITKQQKDSLKMKVKEINLQLEDGKISKTKADELKREAAQYHAKRIEYLVAVQERKLQQLVQDKVDGKILGEDRYYEESTFSIGSRTFQLRLTDEDYYDRQERRKRRWQRRWTRRTTSQFVFAMGVNNVLVDHKLSSLEGNPYKFWKSRFYEVGFTFKYRLQKEASKTYLKYGLSFLWNNLRPDGNQYHVVNGQQTNLEVFPFSTSESRLRHVQMIFPLHLEFDFSRDRKYDDGTFRDYRNRSFRFGIGGFAGFKLGTRQYLEYRNASGTKVEELQKGSFNTNIYNYGISTYFAYRSCGLYLKYDLNPLFKGTETRNISMGVRFDLD